MTNSDTVFISSYRNFVDLDGSVNRSSNGTDNGPGAPPLPPNRKTHFRRNSLSLRDVAQMTRQESTMLRKGVLEKVFDLNNSEDQEDLSHEHTMLYLTLHPRCKNPEAKIFKKFITCIIILDLFSFILSTEDALYAPNQLIFHCLEGVTSSIFLIEYMARLVTITENARYGTLGPIRGRLKWMLTFPAIVDMLATVPFFFNLATDWSIPSLSYTRIFRVLRLLKTDGYRRAFGACYRVIYYNREILYVAVLVCFFLVLLSSVLLYYCRPRNVDVKIFESIPATLYTSLLMLTGQDTWVRNSQYMPWYTKTVVGFTGALSVAMFALPVSLLTWGFESEAIRCARRTSRHLKRANTFEIHEPAPNLGVEKVDSLNSDEEYLRIIARDSSDDSDTVDAISDHNKRQIGELVERFLKDDGKGTKFVALSNFLLSNIEYKAETDMTLVEGFRDAVDSSDVRHRLETLEMSVLSLHSKLDFLVRKLETEKNAAPISEIL
ncbi:ion transport protein [Nitzschia inconspicua]|uniref:Ion transport protein n=1 Tax=Nitzschia inconspicua TaxID=303405 RepID=A0A9K3KEU4_9STRA|nr:ion transport protein [Nitzschia inconspicua]